MKESYTEQSHIHKPYLYGFLVLCLLAAAYTGLTIRFILEYSSIPWRDVITLVIIWCFLSVIGLSRSVYVLEDKEIVMSSKNPLRRRTVRIPYKDINGVHPFKVQLVKNVFYRYTFRLYSILDNRPIWSLIYVLPGKKERNARILMKASEPFWEAFEEKCPGRIRISQEEAVTNTYRRMQTAEERKAAQKKKAAEAKAAAAAKKAVPSIQEKGSTEK